MASSTADAGPPDARRDDFRAVTRFDLADEALWRRWADLARDGVCTVFQTPDYLRPLLCDLVPAFGRRPFVVEVFDGDDRLVLALGLAIGRVGLQRRVEFADLGLCDCDAPIWRRDLDLSGARAAALRTAVLDALPPHDALVLSKMPIEIDGHANPLARWPGVKPMNAATMVYDPRTGPPGDLPAVREAARKRRRLEREGGSVARVVDPEHALECLDFVFLHRARRARATGGVEVLERPEVRAFYRSVVAAALASGSAVVYEVVLDDDPIGVVQGFCHRGRFNGTLMAIDEAEGHQIHSPGMVAVATALVDHVGASQGPFDLGPGEQPYKARFGGRPVMMLEYVRATSWLGHLTLADRFLRHQVRTHLRRHPALRAQVDRLRRRL